MKLLYISCHSVLEYDELKLFDELGIDVFSHGVYKTPFTPGDPQRPALHIREHPELVKYTAPDDKLHIPKELFDWSDIVYFMHREDIVASNWPNCKHKRCIFRSIGQSTINVERELKPFRAEGLEIVRYSPRERTIPEYQGENAMIRFYKDPADFTAWTGEDKTVITFGQSMLDRRDFCNYDLFDYTTIPFPRKLYGTPSKKHDPLYSGWLPYEELKKVMRTSRVYFYAGTYPASYTLNFIEAFMTGIPIVAVGPHLGNSPFEFDQNTYEIPDIINNGINGFFSDDPKELQFFIKRLMDDYPFARGISEAARNTAIKLFGKDTIKSQWKDFFHV